jgi:coproporphyrinogen III oxidase
MSLMKGNVFEKVGVNISTVFGHFSPEFRTQIPGAAETGAFWASGISLVAHLKNPHVPAAHLNTRHIVTSRGWFGGGADLNPVFPDADDTQSFHARLKQACDAHNPAYFPAYQKWCDEYFFITHRNVSRGAGGIFYDNQDSGNWGDDFALTRDVGLAFLDIFPTIVRKNMLKPFTEADRHALSLYRGRYAEFNLVYDRGTKFGLMTGGNPEAVLMSLPPEAKWE